MKKELNGVIFYDELAEIVDKLSEEEVQYYDLIENISDQLYEFMRKKGMKKSELAEILSVSRSYVTQVLRGRNLSLKTLNRITYAMNGKINIKVTRKNDRIDWFGLVRNDAQKKQHVEEYYIPNGENKGEEFLVNNGNIMQVA